MFSQRTFVFSFSIFNIMEEQNLEIGSSKVRGDSYKRSMIEYEKTM